MMPTKKPTVMRATFVEEAPPLTLRNTGGGIVGATERNALLADVHAGKHVELELDIMPFRQRAGERNRNLVRFREGALRALGRSGKGMPFLRDHEQGDSLAVGGEIIASKLEPEVVGAGAEWRLHQTVRLSAPWAVELALRGLIKFFSIGWDPTGPVLCTACGKDYHDWSSEGCRHYRGQVLEDGTVVEIEYQDAILVETSCVPVPAVLGTEVEEIRAAAALSAGANPTRGPSPHEEPMLQKIAGLLSLAATASESEITAAVETLTKRAAGLEKELAVADADNKRLTAEVEGYKAETLKREEHDFIDQALKSGRIGKGDEPVWRELFQAQPERARLRMAERKPGASTPVGQPRQSDKPEPTVASDGGDDIERARAVFAQHGVSFDASARFARMFGVKKPKAALAKYALGPEAGEEA